jgi:hypothetical protein
MNSPYLAACSDTMTWIEYYSLRMMEYRRS